METQIIFNPNSVDNLNYRKLKSRLKEMLRGLPKTRRYIKILAAMFLTFIYFMIYLVAISTSTNLSLFYLFYSLLGII